MISPPPLPFSLPTLFFFFTLSSSLFPTPSSAEYHLGERASALACLAKSGTILVDQRSDPFLLRASISDSIPSPAWEAATNGEETEGKENNHSISDVDVDVDLELERQRDSGIEPESREIDLGFHVKKRDKIATVTPSSPTSTSTLASSPTGGGLQSAATVTAIDLPIPFDSGFSSNITSTCASFMESFLVNETFRSCVPFSLMLQNSNSFFQASKSLVRITQTLDASCSADQQKCSALMASLAANITSTNTCSTDLLAGNPLINQARLGLLAYSTLFTASCLKDPSNGAYCYAEAVTNASSPTDSYIYYLPLKVSLPSASQPSCNACLKNTMAVFQQAGSVKTSAIAGNYVQAASQINARCGPGFVNETLPVAAAATGGAGRVRSAFGGAHGGMMGNSGGVLSLFILWIAVFGWGI
ncbi:hypothetical protein DSL72_007623 [Monilinia vaccinii-corymbosi]|uniref:DUF7729 domain-containing protein n=1 Tax=Monilinia vaccinii-corymbosi TaxID=61207 RepID=A0A8A3PIA2_9HELO|nr:hypothetical protein DSL72_007623 [Monilinia vaccinii-corymbosi]